jgi:hypothetical protein
MSTPLRPDEAEAERPAKSTRPDSETRRAETPADPAKPAGLSYVFKIAPADPKNAFDFEDVADK